MAQQPQNQKQETRHFTYINGLTIHNTRNFCKLWFEGFLYKVEANEKDQTFDIYLIKGVDLGKAKKWVEHFGKNFRIKILEQTDLDDLINE